MSYTKTNWVNDTEPAINADNLNKIEQGIYDNDVAINEKIDNTYGTSQTKGYSQEYQNAHNVVVSKTQPSTSEKVWFAHGKNLFDGLLELGTFSNEGVKSVSQTNYRSANRTKVKANTTYTFSINGVSQKYAVYYYDKNGFWLSSVGLDSGTFTTPNNCKYVSFRCFNADFTNDYANLKVQLEEGLSATTYEAHILPTVNIDGDEKSLDITNLFHSGNDYYIFPNGLAICWGEVQTSTMSQDSGIGGYSKEVSLPITYATTPTAFTGFRYLAGLTYTAVISISTTKIKVGCPVQSNSIYVPYLVIGYV